MASRKKAKKAAKRSKRSVAARKKTARTSAARKPARKRAAKKRPAKKRSAQKRPARRKPAKPAGITAAELAARLRADSLTASSDVFGRDLPYALLTKQYGPASKRTILAALNILAGEGRVSLVRDGYFQLNAVTPQK